ncbi:unnamed protein product [Closterium sp. Naga37s-1]|nr:unnamed protein product [Closterium sp. Naga37s-1]
MEIIRADPRWAADIESRLQYLVLGPTSKTPPATAAAAAGGGGGAAAAAATGWPRDSVRLHIFRPMGRERREAVHQMAGRWRLETVSKGAEPHRFTLVYTTSKSRAPTRKLPLPTGTSIGTSSSSSSSSSSGGGGGGGGGSIGSNLVPLGPGYSPSLTAPAPPFDPEIDLNPARVVALLSLPRDSNVATQLVRFGGECELVWVDDRNAVAVFEDPGRAATAMRFLDHVDLGVWVLLEVVRRFGAGEVRPGLLVQVLVGVGEQEGWELGEVDLGRVGLGEARGEEVGGVQL